MKKFVVSFLFLFLCPLMVSAASTTVSNELVLAPNAKSALIMEQSTGEILYEKNSHEKIAPASMTKMMSLLLIMESLDSGKIKMSDEVTVSKNASSMGGSQILLEEGEIMTVEDLLKGIAIASGNDAVVAMAEYIAGTESNFVKMMNSKSQELGLTDTNFKNCHGLDEANHYSSAHDMSVIAKRLLEHKKILEFTSVYETYLRENTDRKIWLVNTNKLVRFKEGVDGLKTGYTETAGYCLAATMKKDNMRVIATVMGEDSIDNRNSEVSSMLDYAFSQYKIKTLIKSDKIVKKIKNSKLKGDVIKIVPIKDVNVLTQVGTETEHSYSIKINNIKTNIKKGDKVGILEVKSNGKIINKINLTVKNDVKKANIFELYLKYLKDIANGNMTL